MLPAGGQGARWWCAPASAQIFPSWQIADPCGGRPAWINTTTIVEDSNATGSSVTNCATTLKSDGATPLFNLMSVSYSGGVWQTPVLLTTAGFRSGMSINSDCSVGNADSDGTNLVAIVQNPPGVGACGTGSSKAIDPGTGYYYDLMFCNSVTTLSSSNCAILVSSNKGNPAGGFLDPRIDGSHVYVSERNPTSLSSNTWTTWTIDDIVVTWNSPGTPPSLGSVTQYYPGSWSVPKQTLSCTQYYKATSFQHLNSGVTRIFTQADQVSNYSGTGTCPALGANPLYSGIFYFDLQSSPTGANFTQIYPPPAKNCLTPAGNTVCYSEFPWVIPNGDHLFMIFDGQEGTPGAIVDKCASFGAACQTNFVMETLFEDLGTDTQTPTPGAVVRATDAVILGTALNSAFLTGPAGSGVAVGYVGDCSHLSVNAAQQVACSFRTNVVPSGSVHNVAESQAVVFPLQQTMLYPSSVLAGKAKVTGKAKLK